MIEWQNGLQVTRRPTGCSLHNLRLKVKRGGKGELQQNSNEPGNIRSPAEFQGYSRERHSHIGRVNFAAAFARLLKQAKLVFGVLTSGKIRPPSASADGQASRGVHSPASILAGRGDENCVAPAEAKGRPDFFATVSHLPSW